MVDLCLLDSGPLGLITNPRVSPDAQRLVAWMMARLAEGARVMVPEVIEYEVRRELVRAGKAKGLSRLDILVAKQGTLPLDGRAWRLAADLWAEARRSGFTTAKDAALDADVILAAVARLAAEDGTRVVVVTGNVGHLARFCNAVNWKNLSARAT